MTAQLHLLVQREIRVPLTAVFDAWTRAEVLTAWWGPAGVECIGAEIDLRVGGTYRIGNQVPDGGKVWIHGEYLEIERPSRLVFSWQIEGTDETSKVTVSLTENGETTRVVVLHEQISTAEIAADHEYGWNGCLDGLVRHFA